MISGPLAGLTEEARPLQRVGGWPPFPVRRAGPTPGFPVSPRASELRDRSVLALSSIRGHGMAPGTQQELNKPVRADCTRERVTRALKGLLSAPVGAAGAVPGGVQSGFPEHRASRGDSQETSGPRSSPRIQKHAGSRGGAVSEQRGLRSGESTCWGTGRRSELAKFLSSTCLQAHGRGPVAVGGKSFINCHQLVKV